MDKTIPFFPILVVFEVRNPAVGREKKLNFCSDFEVSGSNLVCASFLVSFCFCFSNSELSEITRAGDENSHKKTDYCIARCRPIEMETTSPACTKNFAAKSIAWVKSTECAWREA